VEAPIDVDNHGVFFLNSRLTHDDITDGAAHTLFVGEKRFFDNIDLGWMSGTRATLRNTGTPPNVTGVRPRVGGGVLGTSDPYAYGPSGMGVAPGDGSMASGMSSAAADSSSGAEPQKSPDENASEKTSDQPGEEPQENTAGQAAAGDAALVQAPTAVGGFASTHPGIVQFVMGDGRIKVIRQTIDMKVYQQLGHRADGQLLDEWE
jgi:hypothetical protein